MQGSLVEELKRLVARAGQPKATLLPAASKAATAFHQAVHSLVYDMLMQKVEYSCFSSKTRHHLVVHLDALCHGPMLSDGIWGLVSTMTSI